MKRHNYQTDLSIYRKIFNIYYQVVSTICQNTDLELEDLQQERHLFRPKRGGSLRREYLRRFEAAGLQSRRVELEANGFRCAFKLEDVITFKRLIERRLITPKHHLYYFRVQQSYKDNKAA